MEQRRWRARKTLGIPSASALGSGRNAGDRSGYSKGEVTAKLRWEVVGGKEKTREEERKKKGTKEGGMKVKK